MAIRLPSRQARRRPRTAIKPVGSIAHIAARVFNTPLLIHEPKLRSILAVLGPRLGLREDMIPPLAGILDDPPADAPDNDQDQDQDEYGGVQVIPVHGTLVQRSQGMSSLSGMTSYESLRADFEDAMNDPACKAVVLDFDSPGGEVAGMFELGNILSAARGSKPVIGVSNEAAFSAAYALASCCTRLFVGQTAGVGSIGCYMLHCDQSGYDEQKGLSYTYIYSGDNKVDGNPHEPLSKDAKAQLQAEVDKIRDMFVQMVARNRGMDSQKVYDTEAATYMGSEGVNMMLADDVGTLDDAIQLAQSMTSGARSFHMTQSVEEAYKAAAAKKMAKEFDLKLKWDTVALHQEAESRAMAGLSPHLEFQVGNELLAFRRSGSVQLSQGFDKDKITGILCPYDSLSCDLGGFKEVYQPGCFAEFLKSGEDACVFGFHNPENVLGRIANGTARFWEEADGLHYEADLPDTQFARDLKTLIERGDVKGSSAAFYILQHRWESRSTGRVRIIEKAKLVEGSPHSLVSYESSTAKTVVQEDQLAATHEETETALARSRRLRLT